MPLIQTILNVRPCEALEKAIASTDVGSMSDKDLSESFLNEMSVDYRPGKQKNRKLVVESPADEGQNYICDDTVKDQKLPQNP